MGNDKQIPDDDTQMAIESSGEDAVGTAEDPAKRPEPVPDEDRPVDPADDGSGTAPDADRPVPEPVSDGDAVAGNPDSASPAEPDLPADVGPDAVPPANAESNEYDKE
ncbi:hypothetical protein [Nocardioides jiangxiensis]|uniref:Uncharacterized protein n=1 Tax=Nocardioides jiangxiensis TaxID=3064524 RepID=A0ABT9B3M9_9ACTN|nr:hypothetical protein [Nocardioides sp. WY-20]MDO7868858.1 hypothetical protein [Nocardioides sp. WY-20]